MRWPRRTPCTCWTAPASRGVHSVWRAGFDECHGSDICDGNNWANVQTDAEAPRVYGSICISVTMLVLLVNMVLIDKKHIAGLSISWHVLWLVQVLMLVGEPPPPPRVRPPLERRSAAGGSSLRSPPPPQQLVPWLFIPPLTRPQARFPDFDRRRARPAGVRCASWLWVPSPGALHVHVHVICNARKKLSNARLLSQ